MTSTHEKIILKVRDQRLFSLSRKFEGYLKTTKSSINKIVFTDTKATLGLKLIIRSVVTG